MNELNDIDYPNAKLAYTIIQNLLKNQDLNHSQVLHIGDNPIADYKGAKDFGFNAHLLTPKI